MNQIEEIEPRVSVKLYDLKQLNAMVEGNTEFLVSLMNIYLNTVPANSRQMAEAAAEKDWLTVSVLAHKMKPTIDTMKIMSITSDIRTLETDAKNKVNTHILGKIAVKVDNVINEVALQLKYEYNL
jgi:HPt (histidine-containing phosphotransfer) domain-containing protein